MALLLLAATALAQLGGSCGGGSGGGERSLQTIRSPDARCAALGSPFPPGFAWIPGQSDLVWSADFAPPTLLPFDVESVPPEIPAALSPLQIPFDSDGDGFDETFLAPVPDDLEIPLPRLGLVTASSYEEVIFFDPALAELVSFEVSVPAGFADGDYPFLPDPGTTAPRTAVSSYGCVRPPPGARDSRNELVSAVVPPAGWCEPGVPSYYATFTSGAALAGGHLFVSTSNLGDDQGSADTQYLPGSVLVYDVDLAASPPRIAPDEHTPFLFTSHFNPTHVTAYAAGGREFALVTNSGAIGIAEDDPGTPEIEARGLALTDAAIDVIDARTLALVATIPLGRAGLYADRLAIDPTGRVAAAGSAVARELLAVDLQPLRGLPDAPAAPLVLDGSSGPDAVIFDTEAPFHIPARPDGAPAGSCPGFTAGVAWSHAGDRLFAGDYCDGTLGVVRVDLSGSPPVPVPAARFGFIELIALVEPLRADTLGRPRKLGSVETRPGAPGVDFSGPNLFFAVGEPGLLCGISAP
jgi:hypothetical protein